MAELSIARPYAKAAFEYALDKKTLTDWSGRLAQLAELVQQPELAALLSSPICPTQGLMPFFQAACQLTDKEAEYGRFMALLVTHRRLLLMPEIALLFETMKAEHEAALPVVFISAQEKTPSALLDRLTKVLAKQYQKQVVMTHQVDKTLIGGAIVRIGDTVIDGSLKGQLARLNLNTS